MSVSVQVHAFSQMIYIQGRELYFGDFKRNILQFGLHWCLVNQFVSNLIDMTKLYILLPVRMTSTFTQSQWVT